MEIKNIIEEPTSLWGVAIEAILIKDLVRETARFY
jgi:hypothetical protein